MRGSSGTPVWRAKMTVRRTVVVPAGAVKETCFKTGVPGLYSKLTSVNSSSPRIAGNAALILDKDVTSRIRWNPHRDICDIFDYSRVTA